MAGHIDAVPVEPVSLLNKSDSMSSYGSPITFTARTASTDTMEGQAGLDGITEDVKTSTDITTELGHSSTDKLVSSITPVKPSADTKVNLSDNSAPSETEECNVTVCEPSLDSSVNPVSSTPDTKNRRPDRLTPPLSLDSRPDICSSGPDLPQDEDSELISSGSIVRSQVDGVFGNISVPIQGYEVMEERTRFTVYKVAVHKGDKDKWFIFRRYNDFVHLNDQLRELFPHFRLALPPKKWFGDNFDKDFIEERVLGLQAFLNNVVGHRDVCNSEPVRHFFCFDDPPGPHDSLEESKAMCESLEEALYSVKRDLREKDAHISLLEEELALRNAEIDNLRKSLRIERALNTSRLRERASPSSQSQKSENSLPEALMEDTSPGINSVGGAGNGAEADAIGDTANKLAQVNLTGSENSPAKRSSKQRRSKGADRAMPS